MNYIVTGGFGYAGFLMVVLQPLLEDRPLISGNVIKLLPLLNSISAF